MTILQELITNEQYTQVTDDNKQLLLDEVELDIMNYQN